MNLITIPILWLSFIVAMSILEGLLYHYFNEHILFNVIRLTLFIPLVYALIFASGQWYYGLGMLLVFPFFHDGVYYVTRKKLSGGEKYKRGWWDQSTTTTALISINWQGRTVLALMGVILYTVYAIALN